MSNMTYAAALEGAIAAEMRADQSVFHMGTLQPADLLEEFGSSRVRRTPISESAMTGMAIGAAGSGWRPIVNWRCTTFTFVAFDQIVNQAAKIRYMLGGQQDFPLTFRAFYIGRMRSAAQHSQTAYAMFAHVPGLKLVAPSTPADAMGLLRSSIRDNNTVVCFEATILDSLEGEVPDDHLVPLGKADVKRSGSDVTVVSIGSMLWPALDAAEELEELGISAEVIDPRTLVPLDTDTIKESVIKTGRLVVVDESPPTCSFASEIAALIAEDPETFRALLGPTRRVTAASVPVPYSPPLEDEVLPGSDDVVTACVAAMGHKR